MKKILMIATNGTKEYQQWTDVSANAYHEQYNTCMRILKERIKADGEDISSFTFSEKAIEE